MKIQKKNFGGRGRGGGEGSGWEGEGGCDPRIEVLGKLHKKNSGGGGGGGSG